MVEMENGMIAHAVFYSGFYGKDARTKANRFAWTFF